MSGPAPLRVLLVDDEPPARRRLRALLRDEPGVEIVGECEDGEQAVDAVRRLTPDLLLLDVQMPGLDGFEVIEALGPARRPAVIFVTAYDEYALRAFEVHALDYLLKPFDRARLRDALAHARASIAPGALGQRLEALLRDVTTSRRARRLIVRSRGRVQFVPVEAIDWIESAGHYVTLHCGRETHLIRDTMTALEGRLDPDRFLRVHRSTFVNVDRIRELQPSFHGEFVVMLRDGTRLQCSRTYARRIGRILTR
jgi:two-component system LytT family response regulator